MRLSPGTVAIALMLIARGASPQTAASSAAAQNSGKAVGRPTVGNGIEGEWRGALQAGESQLNLVLHLSAEKSGQIQAKLDSPEQGSPERSRSSVGVVRFERTTSCTQSRPSTKLRYTPSGFSQHIHGSRARATR